MDIAIQFAYIDGGTGSLLVQAALAGILGLAATIRVYWAQIKMRLSKTSSTDGRSGTEDA